MYTDIMIMLVHIAIALSSIVYTTFAYLRPSKQRLHVSYGLMAMTLASGMYLVASQSSAMMHACISGIFYLAGVSLLTVAIRRKLAVVAGTVTE